MSQADMVTIDTEPYAVGLDEGQGDMLTAPGVGEPTGICINEPEPDIFKEKTLKAINESLAEKFKTCHAARKDGDLTLWDKWLIAVQVAHIMRTASN